MDPIWLDRDRVDQEVPAVDYQDLRHNQTFGLDYYSGKPFTGYCRERYPNGTLASVVQLVRGLNAGVTVAWHPNGQIASYGELQDGVRHGLLIEWNEEGAKVYEKQYHDGRLLRS
ncbi:hypothetical protein AYO40_00445 [Planctomycetaceae bacterium SCGC AG-212-D15]|nr:hypothetical protein AYO40_00445 [Planctomycetaceae bacterium SCGC AG-212-D15]